MDFHTFIHSALFKGAMSGLVSAMLVDFHAFMSWKSLDDFKKFDYKVAAIRWAQGLIAGALIGTGMGNLL